MAQGLEVSYGGSVIYSTEDYTWFLLDTFVAPANSTINKSYTIPAGSQIRAQVQMINVPPASVEDYTPVVGVNGNSITVYPASGVSSAANITVFAEV